MLELFKLIKMLKGNPIIFNDFCHYYDPQYKSYRPFIIFYNEDEDCYYYLKAKSANFEDGSKKYYDLDEYNTIEPFSKNFKGGVLLEGTEIKYSLLEKDSLVDCSQIFKIDAKLLESIVDKESVEYIKTNIVAEEE